MNKNLKDRADRLWQSVYLDGYEHGYKDALMSISNNMGSNTEEKIAERNIKLIIDIPEDVYKYLKSLHIRTLLEEYVVDGIPLDSSIEIIDNTGDTE